MFWDKHKNCLSEKREAFRGICLISVPNCVRKKQDTPCCNILWSWSSCWVNQVKVWWLGCRALWTFRYSPRQRNFKTLCGPKDCTPPPLYGLHCCGGSGGLEGGASWRQWSPWRKMVNSLCHLTQSLGQRTSPSPTQVSMLWSWVQGLAGLEVGLTALGWGITGDFRAE